jgi:hypothetical protein
MPILKNARHELFAQGVATGKSATQARRLAGYRDGPGARAAASRLLTKSNVRARVAELKEEFSRSIVAATIAEKSVRIAILDDFRHRMQRLFEARAVDMADVPGGDTGLIVRQIKSIGFGKQAKVIEEYAFDAALVREARATLEQVAEETDTKKPAEDAAMAAPDSITYRWAQPTEFAKEAPKEQPAPAEADLPKEQVQ